MLLHVKPLPSREISSKSRLLMMSLKIMMPCILRPYICFYLWQIYKPLQTSICPLNMQIIEPFFLKLIPISKTIQTWLLWVEVNFSVTANFLVWTTSPEKQSHSNAPIWWRENKFNKSLSKILDVGVIKSSPFCLLNTKDCIITLLNFSFDCITLWSHQNQCLCSNSGCSNFC